MTGASFHDPDRSEITALVEAIRSAHMTALMDLGGSYDPCDCECDDCTRAAEAILAMPEMQAIRELLAYVATSYARSGVDIFSAANVPDSVRQWVNP